MPDACTLPTMQQPIRIAEFDRFFADAVRHIRRPAPARLDLVLTAEAEPTARDLAERESSCCSLFTFDVDTADGEPTMTVGVPVAYVDVLDGFAARVRIAVGGAR